MDLLDYVVMAVMILLAGFFTWVALLEARDARRARK